MKKILSVMMALMLMLSMTACFGGNGDQPGETTLPSGDPGNPDGQTAITYFNMDLTLDSIPSVSVVAMINDDGTAYVEYRGDIQKIDYAMDASVMDRIAAALSQSGLLEFNGADEYGNENASGSFYCEYADGTVASGGLYGAVTEAFESAVMAMDASVQTILEDVPVYTPDVMVDGNVDADLLAAMQQILNATGIQNLDQYAVSNIAKDEYFADAAGLSGYRGIGSAISCAPMMMTTAYSLVIVSVEDAADISSVREDFESNLNWRRWVCVEPSDALIAQKDGMVLCLLGSDRLFSQTEDAITSAGWTNVENFHNPNR